VRIAETIVTEVDARTDQLQGRVTDLQGVSRGVPYGSFVGTRITVRRSIRAFLIAPAARNFALAAVPQDTIVIHGEADDVVPLSAVLDWARPQVLPIVVVPATGHFFHGQLPLLRQLVVGAWH